MSARRSGQMGVSLRPWDLDECCGVLDLRSARLHKGDSCEASGSSASRRLCRTLPRRAGRGRYVECEVYNNGCCDAGKRRRDKETGIGINGSEKNPVIRAGEYRVWRRGRQRQFFTAKIAGTNHQSGWDSARGAENGIPLWRKQ